MHGHCFKARSERSQIAGKRTYCCCFMAVSALGDHAGSFGKHAEEFAYSLCLFLCFCGRINSHAVARFDMMRQPISGGHDIAMPVRS